jgi:hypothetical protein
MESLSLMAHTFRVFPYPLAYDFAMSEPNPSVRKMVVASYGVLIAMIYLLTESWTSPLLALGAMELVLRLLLITTRL